MRVQTTALVNYKYVPDVFVHLPIVSRGQPTVRWPEI